MDPPVTLSSSSPIPSSNELDSTRPHDANDEGDRSSRYVRYNELPDWLRDNDLVTTGYRPECPSFWSCLVSLVHIHNETISIWSHLLAAIYFLSLYVAQSNKIINCPALDNDDLFLRLYHLSAIFSFTCSAVYHLFCCYSRYVRDLLVRIDYIGITVFITESFMTWIYYAFREETVKTSVYVYAICFGGFLVAVITQLDQFNGRDNRIHRAGLYIVYGLSLIIPVFMLLLNQSWESPKTTQILSTILLTGTIYLLGGLIYTFRLPELFRPGSVDLFGHSHQIFHVIVMIASIIHERLIVYIAIINSKNC